MSWRGHYFFGHYWWGHFSKPFRTRHKLWMKWWRSHGGHSHYSDSVNSYQLNPKNRIWWWKKGHDTHGSGQTTTNLGRGHPKLWWKVREIPPPNARNHSSFFFSGIFVENLPRMFDGLLLSMIFLFSPQVAEIEKSSSRWAPPVAPAQVTSPMRRWIDLLGWKT